MKNSLALLSSALLITTTCFAGNGEKLPKDINPKQNNAIAFTENKGQVYDQNYKARPDVLYGAMTGNLAVHIRKSGVSYQLYRVDEWKEVEDPQSKEKRKETEKQTIYRIDLNWLNANNNIIKTEDEVLPGYNNYYLESCPNGALNVKSYKGITLTGLYKGINLHYYEKGGELKHDYIVAPHADYKQIQIEVRGAEVKVNTDGSLTLKTPLGEVQEGRPIVFQKGRELKAKWQLENNVLSFNVENVNPNYELIIDPVTRLWGTYYGGSGDDQGLSCANDALGNVYLSGTATSNAGTVIATSGAHQITNGGYNDAFLVKFNSAGVRQWGSYYGGSGWEAFYSCSIDASGNLYLAGVTGSNTGTVIATAGAHQSTYGGNNDALLVKFDAAGVRQWGSYYGGSGSEYFLSCSIDGSGNVYFAGYTNSNTGTVIATAGAHQSIHGGSNDAFLVKFNASGVRQWGSYYGGTSDDYGYSCSTDGFGNAYLAGYTPSNTGTVIATAGAHQSTHGGGFNDGFLVKFNALGVRQWGTYYGGSGFETANSCSTDAAGNVYLAGATASSTGTVIATASVHQSNYGGGSADAFLVKFNPSGVRQWGSYYGGSSADYSNSCNTDAFGNVYLAGYTGSNSGTVIATVSAHQSTHGGTNDAFIVKLSSSGVRQSSSYYGGAGSEVGYSCSTDALGNVYLTGNTTTNTSTVIATTGAHQTTFGGSTYDGFLVKLTNCVTISPSISVNASVCAGAGINFTVGITGTATPVYNWTGPNSFTSNVQNVNIANASTVHIGVYTVTVNNAGCVETATAQVTTVHPQPSISVNNGTICSGQSFTIIPTGANTYSIQGGNAVVSPSSSSSYTIYGMSPQGCISVNTATSNLTVNTTPTVSVNNGTICSGNNFTIVPGGANTYTIQGGNSVVSPSTSTSYTVTGTSTEGCISANTATSNLTVNTTPTVSVNNGTICSGQSFTILPTGANTYTFQGGNAIVSPNTSSSYTVSGTSTEGCISANTATSNLTVNPTPTVSVNNGTICSGNSFTIIPAGAITYTIQGGNAVVSPNTSSSYTVSGSSSGCLSANTATSNVNVNPLPVINISAASSVICEGEIIALSATGANTYTWSTGANASSITVSPVNTTTYTVIGEDTNGCENNTTFTLNVNACTGLADYTQSAGIKLYPNPNNGDLYVETSQDLDMAIYNSLGQLILLQKLSEGKNQINLHEHAIGIYFIEINQNGKTDRIKLIKE